MINEILSKYTTPVEGAKSLKIDFESAGLKNQRAGLIDHLTVLKFHLAVASILELTLILPDRILDGRHNHGNHIKLDWFKYFDFSKLNVCSKQIDPVQKIEPLVYKGFFSRVKNYQETNKNEDDITFLKDTPRPNVPFSKAIVDIADYLIEKHNIGTVVHVRGGDRAKLGYAGVGTGEDVENAISPSFVNRIIESFPSKKNIYIMTVLDPSEYDGFSSKDLGIAGLTYIDNYLLFCIERQFGISKKVRFIDTKKLVKLQKEKKEKYENRTQ